MTRLRLLLVDDHDLVREMLSQRLGDEPGFVVVGSAPNAEAAISLARSTGPDIVVMDIDMPGLICFDAAETIRAAVPQVRIMFLSAFSNDHYIAEALRVGARAYVTKGHPPSVLVEALQQVARGAVYYSADIQDRIVIGTGYASIESVPQQARSAILTSREQQVLCYLARGLTKRSIADTMAISIKTVESHAQNLMRKLDVHDRVELARYAFREGMAHP